MTLAPETELDTAAPRTEEATREFESMMRQTRRRAYAMALQLTRNPNEAEDLVQETFFKAWKGYDSYIPGRPFLNWLLRIMQRAYLDSRRRDNPIRKADSLNSMMSPSDGEIQEIPVADERANPQLDVERFDFSAEVHAALQELPEVYRTAIMLCDLEQLSYSEIADSQNTTIGTVRSRIHRGRRLLREVIQKRGRLQLDDF